MVDTHTHLHFHQFDLDREDILRSFEKDGISFVINVGVNLEDSKRALELAEKFENVFVAVGVHPHDSKDAPEDLERKLREFALSERVVAVGETGLDFYRNLSPREIQVEIFERHLSIAQELNLPVIVHVREAYKEAYEILKKFPGMRGVVHSFSANYTWARKFLDLGFHLGVGGPITYPKNEELRDVVRKVGLDFLLLETDCPFLPPQPFRGKRNEPRYLKFVLEEVSKLTGFSPVVVDEVTTENAKRLFGKVSR